MPPGPAPQLAARLAEAGPHGTVVFTGAGISTESGIPDFRSPNGLWSRYAPIPYSAYLDDPAQRREAWQRGLQTYAPMLAAQPNAAHRAVARWWELGLLNGVVTQNIDGLHQRGGLPDEAIIELHGNAHGVACLRCGAHYPRPEVHARLTAGDLDPTCPACDGMLKTTTISFGQDLSAATIERDYTLHATARLCLVVGSSLVVYPAAALPELTVTAGGGLAIVNLTPTHLDERAQLVLREPAAVLLGTAAALTTAP